ncbi:hypothetical protein E2A64_13315 [Pseudohoeflea suaedae]|uniref:Uncharacterized protein n=1 Tax=Pseudohoeflea suaedae TaxID=877384 RepID=A0A4R5PKL0_9HYPH|nr:hypothetical protein [Pseudohoeflea suaedae]TDH36257.1 hypothetical protein E2A64_13315 [Pseudohoeflea suaedae]
MATIRTIAEVEQKVKKLAEAALITGRPYLLSKLGKDLGEELKVIKSHELTLGEFIKKYLPEYEIVLGGSFKNVQSLVRSGDAEAGLSTGGASEVLDVTKSPNTSTRFNYKFWAAFSVPLSAGKRYINLNNFTFLDDEKEPENGSYEEIDPSYVAEDGIANRDAAIMQNIARWLTDRGYAAEQFAAKTASAKNRTSTEVRTVLHAVIDALDKRQLSSVSLPLDVVAALLHRHA